jgi:hypothetical protein
MRICEKHEHQDSVLPCPVPDCLEGAGVSVSWPVVDSIECQVVHKYVRELVDEETWVWKHIGTEPFQPPVPGVVARDVF